MLREQTKREPFFVQDARAVGHITNNLLEWTVGVDNTTGMVKDNFIQYFGSKQAMSA